MDHLSNQLDYEKARTIILKTFDFLEKDFLYVPSWRIEESNVFIEWLSVNYQNETKSRELQVSYFKGKSEEVIDITFTASITRMPYVGFEDFFSLSVYLNSIGADFNTTIGGDFDEQAARNILQQISTALRKYAMKIIDGKVWLEDYYPRRD